MKNMKTMTNIEKGDMKNHEKQENMKHTKKNYENTMKTKHMKKYGNHMGNMKKFCKL